MKTVLLATDGSDSSERALAFAIELALETGAALEIISVRPPCAPGRAGPGAPILEVEELAGPEHIVEAAAARAREVGVESNPHSAHGDIVACIADAAISLGAELLIVGSRGRGAVSGAMLGSVSQALVRRSPIPVTVVRQTPSRAADAARV
jgi:nucleotide-binding universal stress UspA family protein